MLTPSFFRSGLATSGHFAFRGPEWLPLIPSVNAHFDHITGSISRHFDEA
jgi:hypothetical protein